MDKELENKLVDACFPIMANLNDATTMDRSEFMDKILRNILKEAIRVYELECFPQTDEVVIHFPISQLQSVKKAILDMCAPQVTFNPDFEVMKEERDMKRELNLEWLQDWINRVLR